MEEPPTPNKWRNSLPGKATVFAGHQSPRPVMNLCQFLRTGYAGSISCSMRRRAPAIGVHEPSLHVKSMELRIWAAMKWQRVRVHGVKGARSVLDVDHAAESRTLAFHGHELCWPPTCLAGYVTPTGWFSAALEPCGML